MVLLLFDLCDKIWGGSSATVQIEGRLESTEITETEGNEEVSPEASGGSSIHSATNESMELSVSQASSLLPIEPTTTLQGSGSSSSPTEPPSEPRKAWKSTGSKTQQDKGKRTQKAQPAAEESIQKDRVKMRKMLDSKFCNRTI